MKKILAAGLVLTMGLSLTACMGGTANTSSAASGGSESSSGSAGASLFGLNPDIPKPFAVHKIFFDIFKRNAFGFRN